MITSKYLNATGKRKRAITRVYISKGSGNILINGIDYKNYFKQMYLQNQVELPLIVTESRDKFDFLINAKGGGLKGQAEAIRLGIARVLVKGDEALKPALRAVGLLTRDARVVERKKFGQKKARKRFQFTKR